MRISDWSSDVCSSDLRLKAWDNVNLAVTLAPGEGDFALQLYVKNLFDKAPITGTFTNSDDTGLSTNIFTPAPRIVGLNATVTFQADLSPGPSRSQHPPEGPPRRAPDADAARALLPGVRVPA